MKVPLLDLKAQYATIKDEVRAAIDRVLESQQFILGPECEALERELAAYCHCAHGVGVSSGTDAILAALMALGVGPGDEVVTSPFTFVATAMCVMRLGAKAVFVDIDPATFNLDAGRLEAAITERTKAVMPVHLFGQMADMVAVMEVAERRGIPVVEDAAQAIGAEQNGRRAGSWGALGCLSFFPSKNLGGIGDGGMVVTNDAELAGRLRLVRNQGQRPKYHSVMVGGNFRLDEVQAAVLRVKLGWLERWTEARRANAKRYGELFAAAGAGAGVVGSGSSGIGKSGLVLPVEAAGRRHVYNQYVVRSAQRDALRARLGEAGIGSEVYYPQPMHEQECFKAWGGHAGDFPESERAARESVGIPVSGEMGDAGQRSVVAAVAAFASTADRVDAPR